MKLIGIISDTHSCWDDRYITHFTGCDQIWHAGDVGDITILEHLRGICPVVRAVSGNIDSIDVRRECPEVIEDEIEGVRIWMSHIAGYPGHYRSGVRKILRDHHIKLMITGHSHILKVVNDPTLDLLHINPGAAGWHGWQPARTLIKLTIDAGAPRALDVIELSKQLRQ